MNQGKYLGDLDNNTTTNFYIGVAAYPEKHWKAPNINMTYLI